MSNQSNKLPARPAAEPAAGSAAAGPATKPSNNVAEPSVFSKIGDLLLTAIHSAALPIILGMVTIGLWATVFITVGNTIGEEHSRNYWPSIKNQVVKVISSSMVAIFILLVTSIIYFLQDETKSIYAIFILLTLTAIISYSALAASAAS
jgi:hypothetical protein